MPFHSGKGQFVHSDLPPGMDDSGRWFDAHMPNSQTGGTDRDSTMNLHPTGVCARLRRHPLSQSVSSWEFHFQDVSRTEQAQKT